MTDLRVDIGEVVLRSAPTSYADTFGPLVEARLGLLARGAELPPGPGDDAEASLADQVAREVWDEVRRATNGLGGEQP